jgi:hypothetical protein
MCLLSTSQLSVRLISSRFDDSCDRERVAWCVRGLIRRLFLLPHLINLVTFSLPSIDKRQYDDYSNKIDWTLKKALLL